LTQINIGRSRTPSVAADVTEQGIAARMRLCAAPFKWLLIALIVVSFAGRPWAQSLPASTGGCGGTSTAAMEHAYSAVMDETGKIAASEAAAPQHDSGKTNSANCVKSCAAVQVLAMPAAPLWTAEVWPQTHVAGVEATLNGQNPKPELSPPIALM
jgi:hypothetical protein